MKKNYKISFITIVILIGALSFACADYNYGLFHLNVDGWFTDQVQSGNNVKLYQNPSAGSDGCLEYVITNTSVTTTGQADMAVSPLGFNGFSFTGETTIQYRIAIQPSPTISQVSVKFYSKAATWNSAPYVYFIQNCDGNFTTYNFPIDSTYTYAQNSVSYTSIVTVILPTTGTVTVDLDWCKSFGPNLHAYTEDVWSDFLNYFEYKNWTVSGSGKAVLGHVGVGAGTTGLVQDPSGVGTLSFVSLTTTSSTLNAGGQIEYTGMGTIPWDSTKFIEARISVGTTGGAFDGATFVNGQMIGYCWQTGHWATNPQTFPVDGQFHTYSWSTTAAAVNVINQFYIEFFGHANTEVKVFVDYVKIKDTSTPFITKSGTKLGVYTNPANVLYASPASHTQFEALYGNPPYSWSVLSTGEAGIGTLDTLSGPTVHLIAGASGGTGNLLLTDADGRTYETPSIIVTATSAPLASDADLSPVHHVQYDLFKE